MTAETDLISRQAAIIEGVGLGNIHDIWNLMYHDMKALYTLEQLVNNHYRTRGIEQAER